MRRVLFVAMTALCTAVLAASGAEKMSLADARNQIGAIVNGEKGASLGKTIVKLSESDQKTFLGDVNKSIASLPASMEEKSAKFLNLNREALIAAKKGGNAAALLAEVFATVSPEALTIINERFASDLMNRAANPKISYTDEQYTKICTELMKIINERTEETDNGSARSAFAVLMLVRASNGSPADLADKLIDTFKHDDAKELARTEWIPSALGKDGREQSYESILASADAGRRPDFAYVLVIAGPQHLDSILADLGGKNTDQTSSVRSRTPVLDAAENPFVHQIPTLDGEVFGADVPVPQDYDWTSTH